MDIDEDDDFYGEGDNTQATTEQPKTEDAPQSDVKPEPEDGDLEEGEEEDEAGSGSDSDIDIITERKDGAKAAPPTQQKYNTIKDIPQRAGANDVAAKLPSSKKSSSAKDAPPASGTDLPGLATSKINVDAKPIYEPAGKPITQVNIDEDLNENDKPWRRPGTDVSDYFNYGFDEFTWALYASKQDTLRSEYSQEKVALNNKKMMEDLNLMMMGGMPSMMPGAAGGAEGMTPEMVAMMQQMMTSGMDPSQMDPATLFAGMQGSQGGNGGSTANQGQGFGSQGGNFGQGQNNQMGYGFDQNMSSGGDARNRGGSFGRGRGGRGRW